MSAQVDIPELRRTKIVIMVASFERSGPVRQAYLIARDLRKTYGLNVEVWALSPFYSPHAFEADAIPTRVLGFILPTCPVRSVRKALWAVRLTKIAIALRRAGVGVLLPFGSFPNVVAGLSYRIGGVQTCVWGERLGYRCVREAMAARRYRHFVANSGPSIEYLVRELGVVENRISFIPNAVERRVLAPGADWRARLGLVPGQFLVIKVADFYHPRDHATLIRAWQIVQTNWPGPKPVLALAGSFGNSYEKCRSVVRKWGLETSVRLLGPLKDPHALIAACDLAVFSSRAEGMPNSVLEYMVAGKAVVASDLPGIRDALGQDGIDALFPAGDAQSCAELILKLLHDGPARTAIGEANRDRIRTQFSVDRIVDRYIKTILGNMSVAAPANKVDLARDALAPAREDA